MACRAATIMKPMRHRTLALTAIAALTTGCYTVDIAGQSNFNGCAPSTVIMAGQGFSDFHQRIAHQVAVAPADSVLDAAITFVTAAVQADRDRITAYGGTNILTGATPGILDAEFTAQNLGRYVSEDTTNRLSDVTIYVPACATD